MQDRNDNSEPTLREAQIGPLDPAKANLSWRIWVTRHPVAGALLAGFVATHVATLFGFFMKGIGLPQLIWPLTNGKVVLPGASKTSQFVIGEVFIHGLDGVVFTLIYAIAIFPLFSRALKGSSSAWANMAKGVVFSLAMATISVGFLTPYVYAPHEGAGLFTTGFGWKLVFGIYMFHLAYGVNLGLLYNPIRLHAPSASSAEVVELLPVRAVDEPRPVRKVDEPRPVSGAEPVSRTVS